MTKFTVEVADTDAERAQGLMHREHMPKSAGMLFIFERPQRAAFWMRNTPLPLDLIFIDKTGVITNIHENAIPFDETTIPSRGRVLAVLEVNAGTSETFGFAVGDQMQHPAFDPDAAAWPCP
ncbi:MAG: DUF192 domain-containing protein [Pseudomonadota bacterium]